ncbi:MAG: MobC family plasmid mobilization relaxosome protein [Alphaproteobacteria bacterium]|nr:MobC family plasmid mobilization relaxosome protein [Alphaproteobacteria bacterium]
MARPRKAQPEQKTRFLGFRGTLEDEADIKDKAALLKLPRSKYMRMCCRQETLRVIYEEGHDPEKVRALQAIGNNLNQIARHANATGQIDPTELHEVLAMVRAILTEAGRQAWSRA